MSTEVAAPTQDRRVVDLINLKRLCNIWRMKGDRIVFTNGCFDILHRGHVEYLREAAALGEQRCQRAPSRQRPRAPFE
ncbi:MAG TPA: adenylyltransferase/cytidyltransferase family protein [Flavobacteriales bacterium]|nr:adenylyltransferase/cytidyltransferase family protein [Flavobacteriales bacterium]